ncbi:MAG: CPBP family intramembrane metalloprotease [Candidatus Hydrogenedentes bacterium]|nr:CPBP family intramembrane metalloprotease [Candidatus Hydrogenedentota bacterium]
MNRRGLVAFLLLTFGMTYFYEGCLIAAGVGMNFGASSKLPMAPPYAALLVGLAMWIPALSAAVVVRLVTREGFGALNLRFGSLKPYLFSMLVVPACFFIIYAVSSVFGIASPDWQLTVFKSMLTERGMSEQAFPPATVILPGILTASILMGPVLNGLFAFGEELGWRGYLLPRLMPLGKRKAYLIVGVIWGLWHAPLILVGFNYPGYPILGIVAMACMTTCFGVYVNELTLRHRSVFLAAWIHGAFNGQAYGIWRLLFPDVNPIIGGFTGVVGMVTWLVVGVGLFYIAKRRNANELPR